MKVDSAARVVLPLQSHLLERKQAGAKIFVVYLTAALPSPQRFIELAADLSRFVDCIEVGVPFSDPMMDGPIIQEASTKAIENGVTVETTLKLVKQVRQHASCPFVVMTYFNPIHAMGPAKFIRAAADAGVAGLITPDFPMEEARDFTDALASKGIAHIQMVAPSTSPKRAALLAKATTGFLYAVSRMGVTGEQLSLAEAAGDVVARVKDHSVAPVLLGIGISNGEQAFEAARHADGVIVGSAIMRKVLDDDTAGALSLAREVRASLDRHTKQA